MDEDLKHLIRVEVMAGERVLWQRVDDGNLTDKEILQGIKATAKVCGKQLPKNVRLKRLGPAYRGDGSYIGFSQPCPNAR